MTTAMRTSGRYSPAAGIACERPEDWRARAACAGEDPELFFPEETAAPGLLQAERAKAVCRRCPVLEECRRWNLEDGNAYGVWGGMSERDRRPAPDRGAEYERKRLTLEAGRVLAVERGREVILARLAGQEETEIAEWSGATVFAVRRALRILLPQDGEQGVLSPLEWVLAHAAGAVRVQAREGRTDAQIGRFLKRSAATVSDARRVLEHRDAAVEQIGLAA